MTKVDRNAAIVLRYNAGENFRMIAEAYGISRERVRQILRRNNIEPRKRGNPMRSDRTIFLGVEVTDEVKEALRVEAKRRGVSMSSLTSVTLQEMLKAVHAEGE